MQVNRRQFFKICAGGMAGTSLAALGFSPAVAFAETRQYKLLRSRETRNTCPYCSVGCGLLMYSKSDGAGNVKDSIFHIEGDPDHPVSRGALCPKGSGLIDLLHSQNRLRYPEVREPGSKEWKRISWDEALTRIARRMKDDRDKNFVSKNKDGLTVNRWLTTGYLACTASSNEAGLIAQKFARGLGMVGVDNVARICHTPTVAGLAPSFGRGAMTNHWVDIKNANLIVVMGGNAAEAHPVGFRWALEAKVKNHAKIMVIDPRFNRSAAVADEYMPLRPGTDIAFLSGILNYLITHDKYQKVYTKNYTNATFLVNEGFGFKDGLFSGWDSQTRKYDKSTWNYQLDKQGYVKRDETMTDPHCVWQLLKQHVSRYTPEVVHQICGTPLDRFKVACELFAECAAPDKTLTSLYALGWTEHTVGSQNIRTMAIIQLILGNIGMPGGGINALRGHSNVQGLTDLGVMATLLPGYLALPSEKQPTLADYLQQKTPKTLVKDQVNYWGNTPKFFISLLKDFYGDKATKENDFGYDWVPKWDQMYDVTHYFEMMAQGQVNGCVIQGYNVVACMPDKNKTIKALSNLKYLVVIDPMESETANFWKNCGDFNDVKTEEIQTEVFNLPSSLFAEEEGSITNSGRWVQWHWKGCDVAGEGKSDSAAIAELMMTLKALYQKEGGACPEQVLNMNWNYSQPRDPGSDEVAKEINGKALADITDAKGNVILKKGQQLSSFAQLRDDGTTSCGCWIYTGCWTEAGNQMSRRDNADPSGLGSCLGWSWCWPLNRRILYNRASCAPDGTPWDPKRSLIHWDGAKWTGYDVPDFGAAPPNSDVEPFIMQPDGVGHLFALGRMAEGPFPEHYEPMESPIGTNPLHPKVVFSPTVRLFKDDVDTLGTAKEFPYVATTYRLTEHFNTLTKNSRLNAITQPEAFAEISETLAAKVGVKSGDMIKVSSKRGWLRCKAVVTKRVKKLQVNGQDVEVVGLPIHWGFTGAAKKGFITNTLTTAIGDSNAQTPEFKAFLVNVERAI